MTAGLTALLQAIAATDGEFAEITWADVTTAITATMNTPGTPFTQTSSATGGTAALVTATTTANSSPNDLNNALNYAAGALPVNGDDLVFDAGSVDVWWNLGSLSAVTLATLTRRRTYTGHIALPEYNEGGIEYFEYRATELAISSTVITWEQSATDDVAQLKLNVGVNQTTMTLLGEGKSGFGSEQAWFRGTHASNVVNVLGGSLAISAVALNAATVATLRAEDATVRSGSAVTLTTVNNRNSDVELNSAVTTLNQTGDNPTTTVKGSATGATLVIDDGVVFWNSSGTIGTACTIGTDARLDFSQDNRAKTVTPVIDILKNGVLNDPAGVVVFTAGFRTYRCTLGEVTVNVGNHRTYTVT